MRTVMTLLVLATLNPTFAKEGNGAGGGTDTMKEPYAWFLGQTKTIKGCLHLDEKFGVDRETAVREIQNAYQAWQNYIEKKDLAWDFGNAPLMSTKIEIAPQCTGQEDLTFYFGTEDEQVKAAKQHYLKPYGIAERLKYDWETSWSKGFIWIAMPGSILNEPHKIVPNWKLPHTLHGILLHEIGHTLGNEHVKGTIMEENFGWAIYSQTEEGNQSYRLTHIDETSELHLCRKCGATYVQDPSPFIQDFLKAGFKEIMGRDAVGKVLGEISYKVGPGKLPYGTLTCKDDKGEVTFHLKATAKVFTNFKGGSSFQAVYKSGPNTHIGTRGNTDTLIFSGEVEGLGKKHPVLINRNGAGHVQVSTLGGQMVLLSYQEKP